MAGPGGSAYTVAEFLADLRSGAWTELSARNPRVDVFRRTLQRAYLEAAEQSIRPPELPQNASAAARGSRRGSPAAIPPGWAACPGGC